MGVRHDAMVGTFVGSMMGKRSNTPSSRIGTSDLVWAVDSRRVDWPLLFSIDLLGRLLGLDWGTPLTSLDL